jgi:acyl carrier protein
VWLKVGHLYPEAVEAWVERLVREFSPEAVPGGELSPRLSLRDDLAIESLSLVSLAVELGAQVGVDVADIELELGDVKTVGDLVRVAETLRRIKGVETLERSA